VLLTGRDTLDTATTSETTDGRLGDALNVVSQDLSMTLGTTLAQSLSAFAACKDKESAVHVSSDVDVTIFIKSDDMGNDGWGDGMAFPARRIAMLQFPSDSAAGTNTNTTRRPITTTATTGSNMAK